MYRFHSARDSRVRARRAQVAQSFHCHEGRHFRKRHPLDCGVTGCQLCHGAKLYGEPSLQVRRGELLLREGCV